MGSSTDHSVSLSLVDDSFNSRITLDDWSETGNGFHLELTEHEAVPLVQGRFLGRGAMADVYEVTVRGMKLAHKRMFFRRQVGASERKEIEILKKLSHIHVLQLVGTYAQNNFLGLLLYPVAVCDLHAFFEDVEAWTIIRSSTMDSKMAKQKLDVSQMARLKALGYDFPEPGTLANASLILSKIGCILKAVDYLHGQKIRHKDLKPCNILLSRDKLWLSDFGSATDFSLLSHSATENGGGTACYYAPEVAEYQPSGRAADVFSLGCVFLEILVLHETGTLTIIRENRSPNPRFHANLDRLDAWIPRPSHNMPPKRYFLWFMIRAMLRKDPESRPTISSLLQAAMSSNGTTMDPEEPLIFNKCCKWQYIALEEHERQVTQLSAKFDKTLMNRAIQHAKEIQKLAASHNFERNEYEKLQEKRYHTHSHQLEERHRREMEKSQVEIAALEASEKRMIKLFQQQISDLEEHCGQKDQQVVERDKEIAESKQEVNNLKRKHWLHLESRTRAHEAVLRHEHMRSDQTSGALKSIIDRIQGENTELRAVFDKAVQENAGLKRALSEAKAQLSGDPSWPTRVSNVADIRRDKSSDLRTKDAEIAQLPSQGISDGVNREPSFVWPFHKSRRKVNRSTSSHATT